MVFVRDHVLQNIFLAVAQVLHNLPRRMFRAIGHDDAQFFSESRHGMVERGMRPAAIEQFQKGSCQLNGAG